MRGRSSGLTVRRGVQVALAAVAATGLTAIAALLGQTAWSSAVSPPRTLDPAALLTTVAAGAAALVATRLLLCCASCLVACLVAGVGSGGTAGRAVRVAVSTSPRALRPWLSALLAGSIAIGVAGPAAAAAPVSASNGGRPAASSSSSAAVPEQRSAAREPGSALPSPGWAALPAPGWRPTTPRRAPGLVRAATAVHLVTGTGARTGTTDDEVVVRRGDTLWHLAARSLGPSAAAAEVAVEWPRWWRANREVIGADPDLLLPGTRLRAPGPAATDP